MFDYYNKEGLLYININKVTGDKYQFHFETNSYMDADDDEISPRRIGLSEGAIEYYKSIGKKAYIMYDKVDNFSEGFAIVKLVGRGYNFINTNCELVWKEDKWFNANGSFYNVFAIIIYNGTQYNLNTNGEFIDDNGNRVKLPIHESKRRVIRLTESDIHKLVIKTLKEYLY